MTAAQVLSVPETHQQTRSQHHLPERLTCSSQRCGTSSAQDSAGPEPLPGTVPHKDECVELGTRGWRLELSRVSCLLLGNTLPPNLAAENNEPYFSHSVCGSGVWLQLS